MVTQSKKRTEIQEPITKLLQNVVKKRKMQLFFQIMTIKMKKNLLLKVLLNVVEKKRIPL